MGPDKYYPPVDRCIYCSKTAPEIRLTNEHIIPFGMGGNLILPKASCLKCADATKRAEQVCLRKMFIHARTFLKIQTRRPKERPTSFEVSVQHGDGKEATRLRLPVVDLPFHLRMWHLDQAPIISGAPFSDGSATVAPYWTNYWSRDALVKLKGNHALMSVFSPDQLCLMLGKIGHAYAVASLGYRGFEPYLPSMIRDGSPAICNYVGGCQSPDWVKSRLNYIAMMPSKDGHVSVAIQLFSFLNPPTYQVVVGKSFA